MEVKMKMFTSPQRCRMLLPIRIDFVPNWKKLALSLFGDHQDPTKNKSGTQ
jgi:hypothetical protein